MPVQHYLCPTMENPVALLKKYFPEISEKQEAQFLEMGNLYAHWNAQINVISRKDIDQLYERHILHSLAIAKIHTFQPDETVLDLGTGGGFPGIPLAVMFPETQFHLVDSIGKKIKVVQEVARGLQLDNVTSAHVRAEELHTKFDTCVTRAVAPTPELLHWTQRTIKRGGMLLALKGGDLSEELKGVKNVAEHDLTRYFSEPYFETKKVVQVLL